MINFRDVSVGLGGRRALDSVSLSVDRGDLVGLVGPNGAGKTTLLRCLNGVLAPDEGSIRVDGVPVEELSAREHARLVATVPQSTDVGFDFSVREVVAMGRTPHRSRFGRTTGDDREQVGRALERAEVTEFADRPVGSVSGGERQRVLLARALAQDTPVLALDEPTASLDIHHQVRTFGLVRRLVDDGRTAMAAVHDLELAARFCDSLAVLSEGELLAAGPPESVLTEGLIETAFGGRAAVGEHPVTGSVSVTALED